MLTLPTRNGNFTQRHGKSGEMESCCSFNKRRVGRGGGGQFHASLGPFINFQGLVNQEIIQHFIAQLY